MATTLERPTIIIDSPPCCTPPGAATVSEPEAEEFASWFKALADPTRIRILNLLAASPEPVCVCDITDHFPLGQPTISHHLKVLREAGIVGSERQGLWAFYYVEPDALKEVSRWLS